MREEEYPTIGRSKLIRMEARALAQGWPMTNETETHVALRQIDVALNSETSSRDRLRAFSALMVARMRMLESTL